MRFALLLCLAALPALPATAAELVCELPSATNGALLETMKLVALNGHVSRIWHKFEPTSYWDEHEQIDTIVFQSTTKSVGFAGSQISRSLLRKMTPQPRQLPTISIGGRASL